MSRDTTKKQMSPVNPLNIPKVAHVLQKHEKKPQQHPGVTRSSAIKIAKADST